MAEQSALSHPQSQMIHRSLALDPQDRRMLSLTELGTRNVDKEHFLHPLSTRTLHPPLALVEAYSLPHKTLSFSLSLFSFHLPPNLPGPVDLHRELRGGARDEDKGTASLQMPLAESKLK